MMIRLPICSQRVHIIVNKHSFYDTKFFFQGKQSRTISVNAHYFILLKNPRNREQVEAFGREAYQRKSNTFSEAYEKTTLRSHGYLVVDLYPTTPDSCRLRTNIFPGENNQFHPDDIFHTISPIVESFKKKNYGLQATGCTTILQEYSLFSTSCEGEINVLTVSDDGEDLEPSVLRSKQSSKLQWKRSGIHGRKSSIP